MRAVEDESVTLVLTSPPYANAMDYRRYEPRTKGHKARTYDAGFDSYQGYLSLMQRIFSECYRVTKPGGHCIIVVGSIQDDGRCRPIPHDLICRLSDIGWEPMPGLTWNKCASSCDRAGSFILRPYPGYYYQNLQTESVLILRKPGPRLFRQASDAQKEAARLPITPLFTREITADVWHIPVVPSGQHPHPCPFPEELAQRLILLFSYRDDVVLDPFVGSGTTPAVAHALGRRAIGYDLEQQFIDYAKQRVGTPLHLRPKQIVCRFNRIEDDPWLHAGIDDQVASREGRGGEGTE